MRLIDADKLKRRVQSVATEAWKLKLEAKVETTLNQFLDYVEQSPTIDAVEVVHGEWIAVSSYDAFGGSEELWNAHGNPTAFHYCSNCKAQSYVNEFGEELLTDYCPNCGAKMDGERKEKCNG